MAGPKHHGRQERIARQQRMRTPAKLRERQQRAAEHERKIRGQLRELAAEQD